MKGSTGLPTGFFQRPEPGEIDVGVPREPNGSDSGISLANGVQFSLERRLDNVEAPSARIVERRWRRRELPFFPN
jgi:hypothetical protein